MFSLDYRTMSQTLERMRYTGSVEATISSGTFAQGTVFLEVQRGVIQSCMLVTANGQQISDFQQITEQLERAGLLAWRLARMPGERIDRDPASLTRSAQFQRADLSATCYPQHLDADPAWVSTWPLIQRQVYNLCTGQYSEQDIARLLRYPSQGLLNVFNELEQMGVVKRRF